jgi:hypothetical protein
MSEITRNTATLFVNLYHETIKLRDIESYLFSYFVNKFMKNDELNKLINEECNIKDRLNIFLYSIYDTIKILEENCSLVKNNISLSELSRTYLHCANRNYHILNKIIHENYFPSLDYLELLNDKVIIDDTDIIYEHNSCGFCEYENITNKENFKEKAFYYSTRFGLNKPVCIDCIIDNEVYNEVNIDNNIDNDIDNQIDNYIDNDVDNNIDNDIDNQIDNYIDNEVECIAPIKDDYKEGYEYGWKQAMKYIKNNINKDLVAELPELEKCDNCNRKRHVNKCGGTCNGLVKYCSIDCQSSHWKQTHKHDCLKL